MYGDGMNWPERERQLVAIEEDRQARGSLSGGPGSRRDGLPLGMTHFG